MNNLRLKCGPVHRTGTRRLRGSDDGDGVPGWCSSPLSNAFEKKAKARFARKFGFGANAVLLAIMMVISSIVLAVLSTIALIGLSVGLGGLWPQFHLDNPTRIASSIGGVFFMLLGATFLIAIALLCGPFMLTLRAYFNSGYSPQPERLVWIVGTALSALLLALATYRIPLKMGAQHLDGDL